MRCKYCGSNVIHPDVQHKNFSKGKAVAGAILAGPIGATAGAIGTDIKGYKCGNCGAFMEEPMDLSTEKGIEESIKAAENSEDFALFQYYKKQYPNISADIHKKEKVTNVVPTHIIDESIDTTKLEGRNGKLKREVVLEEWMPDFPIFIFKYSIFTSNNNDTLEISFLNYSNKTIRSIYWNITVKDDAKDIISEPQSII